MHTIKERIHFQLINQRLEDLKLCCSQTEGFGLNHHLENKKHVQIQIETNNQNLFNQ